MFVIVVIDDLSLVIHANGIVVTMYSYAWRWTYHSKAMSLQPNEFGSNAPV